MSDIPTSDSCLPTSSSRKGIGGPKTEAGKARSSQNALKHGFTSKTPHLLPNESSEAWTLHHNRYIAELRPANILETDLVRDLAWSRWKMQRYACVEAGVLTLRMADQRSLHDDNWTPPPNSNIDTEYLRISRAVIVEAGPDGALHLLNRYEARISRDYYRALSTLQRLRANPMPIPDIHPNLLPIPHPERARSASDGLTTDSEKARSASDGLTMDSEKARSVSDGFPMNPERSEGTTPNAIGGPAADPHVLTSDFCLLTSSSSQPSDNNPLLTQNTNLPNELPPASSTSSQPANPADFDIESHPDWILLQNILHKSLTPYPEALQAVLRELEKVDDERGKDKRKQDQAA